MEDRLMVGLLNLSGFKMGAFLFAKLAGSRIQQKIGGYIIEFAERNQMMEGNFVGATLITGIHRLRGAEYFCNLLLGQIIVFTKTSDFFDKCAHLIPPPVISMSTV